MLRGDTESQKDNQNNITQQHHLVSVADMALTKKQHSIGTFNRNEGRSFQLANT